MSNPIVQIKRGDITQEHFLYFNEALLSGELCDIHNTATGDHRIFIGDGTNMPTLLNPKYTTHVTTTANTASGFIAYLYLLEECFGGNSITTRSPSSHTITIPPAGENAAAGLITNGNQIIAGDKTFMGSILPENTSATIGAANKKWSNIGN